MWLLYAGILVVLVILHTAKKFKLPHDFPPGPRFALPLVGHAHAIGADLMEGIDNNWTFNSFL